MSVILRAVGRKVRCASVADVLLWAAAQAAQAARPPTVPALREWRATGGELRLRADARVTTSVRALRGESPQLAADLSALSGRTIAPSTKPARPGDVVLTRARDGRLGAEGYTLGV